MSAFALLSRLLEHPEERPEIGADALPDGRAGAAIERFLAETRTLPLDELRRRYVETFDFDRRTSLYLTYHLYGDQRRRGIELVRLKRRFREAGLELADAELPDYLPALLEFAQLAPEPGTAVLASLRVDRSRSRGAARARQPVWPPARRRLPRAAAAHPPPGRDGPARRRRGPAERARRARFLYAP